ncbi:MAG: hypothetical protein LC808_35985 [Actinobacteria bacterium]|nr:hypothetical protein [Actinomycetota bacterium]
MPTNRVTGHVHKVNRKRGAKWYAKYRLPDGRQVQRMLGPAATGKGRPPDGYFTKTTAEDGTRSGGLVTADGVPLRESA